MAKKPCPAIGMKTIIMASQARTPKSRPLATGGPGENWFEPAVNDPPDDGADHEMADPTRDHGQLRASEMSGDGHDIPDRIELGHYSERRLHRHQESI